MNHGARLGGHIHFNGLSRQFCPNLFLMDGVFQLGFIEERHLYSLLASIVFGMYFSICYLVILLILIK